MFLILPDTEVPLAIRAQMWYTYDGAPAVSHAVRDILNNINHDQWISRVGPTAWPLCSPDLNPLDYYMW
jgi:hypothetical protein